MATAGVYFDSALIAKYYLNEPGQAAVQRLAESAGLVASSTIARAEVAAAFHRKFREGTITKTTFASLRGQFAHDVARGMWRFIPITDAILDDVHVLFGGLRSTVYLRAADALHLMTARQGGWVEVYSNDRHLLGACQSCGLRGINPTT